MTGVNPSTALAQVLVDALVRLGVRHAVLCPGSRSSALAYALATADGPHQPPDRRLQLHVRIDERSAGFLALGLARETGIPAVVVTTSGTAVANLHPAVLEAHHSGVPMLVLSADRPHELRGTGANQTTDQVKLFGSAVRLFAEIPAPDVLAGHARSWRNVMSRAYAAAVGGPASTAGPVQVNVAFREPLLPDDDPLDGTVAADGVRAADGTPAADGARPAGVAACVVGTDRRSRSGSAETSGLTRVVPAAAGEPFWLTDGPRTVVLAGDGAGPVAAEVAAGGGWPLLAEPSSGARLGPLAIGPYRLLLDRPELGGAIERVVVFGRPTLSRPVSRLLARDDVEVVVVSTRPDWTDAAARAELVVPAARSVREHPDHPGTDAGDAWAEWLNGWLTAGQAAVRAVDEQLDGSGALTGPLIAREVVAALAPGEALVAGSSNSVRDLDLAAHVFPQARSVLANRGLAGIDGTLSSACGLALARAADARPTPVRVLLGDLAFVHDVNGLLAGPGERRPHVQVVLLDDAGGGIFALLEPGERATRSPADAEVFERVFATPPGAGLPALCAGVGATYVEVGDLAALREALAKPADGTSVLHVRVDRHSRRAQAAALAAAITRAPTLAPAKGVSDGQGGDPGSESAPSRS
jgi:2-succinyl-5-enolpyruvyl-6-hydroxy-3-cyclohexene-1-carboxylate synthase